MEQVSALCTHVHVHTRSHTHSATVERIVKEAFPEEPAWAQVWVRRGLLQKGWHSILALENQADIVWRIGKGQTFWGISGDLSCFSPKAWGCSVLHKVRSQFIFLEWIDEWHWQWERWEFFCIPSKIILRWKIPTCSVLNWQPSCWKFIYLTFTSRVLRTW